MAHSYMMPIILEALGAYKVFGVVVPVYLYLLGLALLSAVGHMDLATNGIFMVLLVKTTFCSSSRVQEVWSTTVAHSALRFLPNLAIIGIGLWLAMATQLA